MKISRILLAHAPVLTDARDFSWGGVPWPAAWLGLPGPAPQVTAFRLRFFWPGGADKLRIHLVAHERYEFYVDGTRAGTGAHWHALHESVIDTYELELPAGEHCFVVRVWQLGRLGPNAQMGGSGGFLLVPDDVEHRERFATGRAAWETMTLTGLAFSRPRTALFTGARETLDAAAHPWGWERGLGSAWTPATRAEPHLWIEGAEALSPRAAVLPPMQETPVPPPRVRHVDMPPPGPLARVPVRAADHLPDEAATWSACLAGQAPVVIPPRARRRVLLQFADYVCAYSVLTVSGGAGARVAISWGESLADDLVDWRKPARDQIEGRFFAMWKNADHEEADVLLSDGGAARRHRPLWWRAGLYVQVEIETADEPVVIDSLGFVETRYPLENEARFACDDPRLAEFAPVGFRSLQMCAHETYIDCPYFEQLMYAGDTRIAALLTYVHSADDRLPRRAIELFNASRAPSGLTASNYPNRDRQTIPPFSLWWIAMVEDLHLWRGHRGEVRAALPGVRAVLEAWLTSPLASGLYASPRGWNYLDWLDGWHFGEPPVDAEGAHPLLNWQLVIALRQAARLERALGEPECAKRWTRLAGRMVAALRTLLWDESRGLFADDGTRSAFSEHAQCLAALAGGLPPGKRARFCRAFAAAASGAAEPPGWMRSSIYFSHYLFEACRELGLASPIFARMPDWYSLKDYDLRTTFENCTPSTARSDCHAWGAHPLFHFHATVAGVRPADEGFRKIVIKPLPGPLSRIESDIPHPLGRVGVKLERHGKRWRGAIALPAGTTGLLELGRFRKVCAGGTVNVIE